MQEIRGDGGDRLLGSTLSWFERLGLPRRTRSLAQKPAGVGRPGEVCQETAVRRPHRLAPPVRLRTSVAGTKPHVHAAADQGRKESRLETAMKNLPRRVED